MENSNHHLALALILIVLFGFVVGEGMDTELHLIGKDTNRHQQQGQAQSTITFHFARKSILLLLEPFDLEILSPLIILRDVARSSFAPSTDQVMRRRQHLSRQQQQEPFTNTSLSIEILSTTPKKYKTTEINTQGIDKLEIPIAQQYQRQQNELHGTRIKTMTTNNTRSVRKSTIRGLQLSSPPPDEGQGNFLEYVVVPTVALVFFVICCHCWCVQEEKVDFEGDEDRPSNIEVDSLGSLVEMPERFFGSDTNTGETSQYDPDQGLED